jgi:hypothetical protein
MKKIIVLILFFSLLRLFSLFESIFFGEPVKFGNNTYSITGGENRGLTATKLD